MTNGRANLHRNHRRRLPAAAIFCALAAAAAFSDSVIVACGIFSAKEKAVTQPGLKAFITWNPETKTESITIQPHVEGSAADFAIVIPTPTKPVIDEAPRKLFADLATFTQLMPLPQPISTGLDGASTKIEGGAVRFGPSPKDPRNSAAANEILAANLAFKTFSPEESAALLDFLKSQHYDAEDAALATYIQKKWFVSVAKIDASALKKSESGGYAGELAPVRFTFASEQCVFPVRILQASLKEKTDFLVYVQAPQQMDLGGDAAWMHSHRLRLLTYMLGTGATQEHQQEMQRRTQWITAKLHDDRGYQSTKLEYARKLSEDDAALIDDPAQRFSKSIAGDLPPGAVVVSTEQFIKEIREDYEAKNGVLNEAARTQIQKLQERYAPEKGIIVKMDPKLAGKGYIFSRYMWYAGRDFAEADAGAVKGLARLKETLQSGQWLTKIRKVLHASDLGEDWVFAPVEKEHGFVRMLPTSTP